jgi:hypothetical protein
MRAELEGWVSKGWAINGQKKGGIQGLQKQRKDTAIVLQHVPGKEAHGQPVARQNALHCALDQTRTGSRIKASSLLF